jgi:ATP-binding cassette subfamily B protein
LLGKSVYNTVNFEEGSLACDENHHDFASSVGTTDDNIANKTSIFNLVIGFNQIDSGSFKIDGIDADKINMRSYRKFISVVPQNSILFSGTIKENITYGRKNVTAEMLDYAVKAAQLESVIEKLPDGINTAVGEHGAKLSVTESSALVASSKIITRGFLIIARAMEIRCR